MQSRGAEGVAKQHLGNQQGPCRRAEECQIYTSILYNHICVLVVEILVITPQKNARKQTQRHQRAADLIWHLGPK
jgi:hypothetical protein